MRRWALASGLLVLAGCGGAADGPELVQVDAGRTDAATGFVAGPGRVVTVAHVLGDGRSVTVGGRPARVLRVDHRLDLAVLAVPGLAGERVRLAAASDHVRLRGRSVPVRRRVTARVREQRGAPFAERRALELGADVSAGDSGAPVLTRRGEVAGVVFARARSRSGVAYAVDVSGVAAVLRSARTGPVPARARDH